MSTPSDMRLAERAHGTGVWWPALVSILAVAMASAGSLMRPAWHDELYTLALARLPFAELFAALKVDSGPPLHYLMCHGLFALIGWPEGSMLGTFLVRLPSVLAFALVPWLVWRWASKTGAGAILAPMLAVIWLPMLYFATEARAYALLALVNGTLWLLGPDLVRRGGSRLVFFGLLAAALPMLHYAGIISFCLLPVLALYVPRSRWGPFAATLCAAALPLALWSPMIRGAPEASMGWVDSVSGPGRPGVSSLHVMAPAGPFPAVFDGPTAIVSPALSTAALLVLMIGCAAGLYRLVRRARGRWVEQWRLVEPAIGLLPVLALALLAVAGVPVYFAGRSESMVWPLVAALVAGVLWFVPKVWRVIAVTPYLAIAVATGAMWLVEIPEIQEPPGVAVGRQLAATAQENDLIVIGGLWQLEVEYGIAQARCEAGGDSVPTAPVQTIPQSQAQHPGWLDIEAATSASLIEEALLIEREMARSGGRVWVVWSPALPLEQTVFPAFAGWTRLQVVSSPVLAVDLLAPGVKPSPVGGSLHQAEDGPA